MDALTINDPYIIPGAQERVEQEYLRRYFVSQSNIEQEMKRLLQGDGIRSLSPPQSATIDTYAALANDISPTGEADDEEDELDETAEVEACRQRQPSTASH